ncbi:MAG TPA: hypothetical protein VI485_15070 [Vicinamibacterales bacterium]|nr:hypothetical protein [Vicinamibacterales bacterium]
MTRRLGLAARGESPAAFDERCIPPGGVAPPSNTPGIFGRRALPAGRLARLGATRDFHHGLLASLAVVVFAVAGASAGPARPLESLRLIVSVAWLNASEQVEHETRLLAPRVPQPSAITASRAPRSVAFRRFPVERWLFQRPPPASL